MDAERVRQAAERYNNRAIAAGWKSRSDPYFRFERSVLTELLETWVEKAADGMPRREAFDARSLKPVLPYLTIAEKVTEGDGHYWRWRLSGTKIAAMMGELAGKRLIEVLPPEHVERWTFTYDCCLESAMPMRIISDFQLSKIEHLSGETLILPLADEHGEPRFLFALALVRMREAASGPYG